MTHEMRNADAAEASVPYPSRTAFETASYVDWPSIFVGAVVALAVAFVLLTFGGAIGLSAVSPWTSTRTSVAAISIGAGFWIILVHVWAFSLGGYLAGRMRHRQSGASSTEVEFRDGAHGAAVWGLAITCGAVIAALATASAVRGGPESNLSASRGNDPVTIATDTLLRTARASPAPAEVRGEIDRLLLRSMGSAPMLAADRTYLVELVAARTGLAPADAENRVSSAVAQMKDGVNRARKAGVVTGFIAAATLLLAAAAAWWGASVGGKHRDENTIWSGFARHGHPRTLWSQHKETNNA